MVGDLIQPTHLILLLVVVLLVFGPKRLPELGRSIGSGLRELRHTLSGEGDDDAEPRERADEPAVRPSRVSPDR